MSIASVAPKVISTLGNPSSLVPILVKDTASCLSLTGYAYNNGGKVEALDRATDEFGTEAIWIGGIPFFKKIIDKTVYKLAKLNPDVDIRIIKNEEYAKWAKENAKGFINKNETQTVLSALEDSFKNSTKAKGLYLGKVIVATALTLGSYFALTKVRQKATKERVEKEIAEDKLDLTKKQQKAKQAEKNISFNSVFKPFSQNQPSFKGLGQNIVNGILFNPVHNMKLIDAGITSQRLDQSRNKTEFAEFAIKEGGLFCFIYFLGGILQKGFNNVSEKILKKPIGLDISVLMSDGLKKGLQSDKIAKDIESLENSLPAYKSKKELKKLPKEAQIAYEKARLMKTLDFIVQNPDNIVVQSAKKAGVVKTLKDSDTVDVSKFISKADFEGVTENLKKIDTHFKEYINKMGSNLKSSDIHLDKFLKKSKGLKVGSVAFNILSSCFVLGYIVPELMYGYREKKRGTKKFHVAEDIKKENGVAV